MNPGSINEKELQNLCTVRIIDDDEDFLNSLSMMLTLKNWYVKAYSRAEKFLADESFRTPGCIILDIRMPDMTGLELLRQLEEENRLEIPIIFLTGHGDVESAVYTLKKGAFHFFQKPVKPALLFETVTEACEQCVRAFEEKNEDSQLEARLDSLTPREKEIFLLAADGKSNKEISAALDIAIPTVKMHRANAFDKMGVHSGVEASKIFLKLKRVEND